MINSINPIGDEKTYNEIKGSDYFELLKFLIRYGYVDETYSDYMTYFYEESLSANDKTFLRRITDKRGADFEYSLKFRRLLHLRFCALLILPKRKH